MSLRHIVFIVNPKAGTERQKEIQSAIAAYLDPLKYTHEIQLTTHAGHGADLAHAAAVAGAYAVVAVGGDGSVNDVVRGLHGTSTILGIIPKGSGNGMARTLCIPRDVVRAMQIINNGNSVSVDVGDANGSPFLSNAGVAFDALISQKFAHSNTRGLAVYSWLVTKYLWLYRCPQFSVSIDGVDYSQKAFIIAIANGTQFGYNFKIAPMADYTDGLFDVMIIRNFPRILGGIIALRAITGTIAGSRYVRHIRGQHIVITRPGLHTMQLDGDARPCAESITFSIRPRSLAILVP